MKKLLLGIFALVFTLLSVVALSACSQWDNPYESYDKNGDHLSVRYVANGGTFNSDSNAMVDVHPIDGVSEIFIIPPESPLRDKSKCTVSHPNDYKFAGWYVAIPVTDENGTVLDANGDPASESGKEPAYTAGARWNFETDKITVDTSKEYSASEPALTLMAMWIPKFTFEFYEVKVDGTTSLIASESAISLSLPKWSNGKLNSMDFPTISGKTFDAAYLDATLQNQITDSTVSGEIDYEKGVAKESTVKIYTTWKEGNWFKIETPSQLITNAKSDGCYMIMNDLDMSKELWPAIFSQRVFNGKFEGNGHKITGIKASQIGSDAFKAQTYGIFGTISSKAAFSDITFENVSFTVAGALNSAAFGLLAADIESGATLTNVSLSGELIIASTVFSDFVANLASFEIGLVYSDGYYSGVTANVTCRHQNAEDQAVKDIVINVNDDGTVDFVIPE